MCLKRRGIEWPGGGVSQEGVCRHITHLVIHKANTAPLQKRGRLPLCLHFEHGVQVELTIGILAHGGIFAQDHKVARNDGRQLAIRNLGRQCLDLNDRLGVGDGILIVPVIVNKTAGHLDECAGPLDDPRKEKGAV